MDTEKLLRLLKENNVCFVVIGATAFPVHGYSRATLDIDLFIKKDKQNAENILKALKSFGYDVSEISVEDLLTKKVLIRQYLTETDLHPFVKGIDFETVWEHKVESAIGSTKVYFASLDDLIRMKQAASRPRDKEDLRVLLEIKKKLGK